MNLMLTFSKIVPRLVRFDLERQILYSKQGRSGQFSSREERDEWIRKESQEMVKSCNAQTFQYHQVVSSVEALQAKLAQERETIQTLRDQEIARKEANESLLQELVTLKAERDQLTDQRKYDIRRPETIAILLFSNCVTDPQP